MISPLHTCAERCDSIGCESAIMCFPENLVRDFVDWESHMCCLQEESSHRADIGTI